ncbi:uncharacterized protein B0I36DRAFT_366400 [Microdochium trichocladiopsis]|uniref:Uncharacterized protein n=1 Tax=Microdochium trichocladiopsis TaxID=1682393 RepID=A0A9P8XXM4_9PEZI|nr:uncharacterized protein B0I36DRAFT_366400 [Microdochium trichocladiopsis]KAH7024454.1 hypothetical protein B0I36DRAFT_366400 [Microdochium trichocladiopsis]
MLFETYAILACMAPTAFAIKVRFYRGTGCSGSEIGNGSQDAPPQTCLAVSTTGSFRVTNVPSNKKVRVQGSKRACQGDPAGEWISNGRTEVCFSTVQYRGAAYDIL